MPTAMYRDSRRKRLGEEEGSYRRSEYNRYGLARTDRRKEYRSRSRSRRREKRERYFRGSSGTRAKRRSDDRKMRLKQQYDYYTVGIYTFYIYFYTTFTLRLAEVLVCFGLPGLRLEKWHEGKLDLLKFRNFCQL